MLNVSYSRELPLPQRIFYFGLRANAEKKEELSLSLYRWGSQAERDELTCSDHPGNLWQELRQIQIPCAAIHYPDFSVILLLCSRSLVHCGICSFLCARKISELVQIYQILLTNSKDCELFLFYFLISVSFLP